MKLDDIDALLTTQVFSALFTPCRIRNGPYPWNGRGTGGEHAHKKRVEHPRQTNAVTVTKRAHVQVFMTKRGRFMGSWLDGRTVSIATSKPDAPDDDRGEYEVNGCDQLSDVLMPQPSSGTEEAA